MEEKNNPIKFYSTSDWSVSYNLEKIGMLLDEYDENKEYTINDYLEQYNALCYFDNDLYLKTWEEKKIDEYKKKCSIIRRKLGEYFNKLTQESVIELYKVVDKEYVDDFWNVLSKYRIYKKIDSECFIEIIKNNDIHPYEILQHEKIVKYYDEVLSEYYYDDLRLAELLISKYIEKHDLNKTNYHFPTKINTKLIIENYISNDDANINHLRAIVTDGELIHGIDNKICYKAKKKAEELSEKFFSSNSGFKYGVETTFDEDQNEVIILGKKDGIITLSYSSKYLLRDKTIKNLLIDNFFSIFEYVDQQSRMRHIHKIYQSGVFERFTGVHTIREYAVNIVFNIDQMTAQEQIIGYNNILNKNGLDLEELIKEYFEKYIVDKYGINGFVFNVSKKDSTFLSKCRNLIDEMESILKQYKSYVEDGVVNIELINFSSTPLVIKDVPSLLKDKYLYPCGDEYLRASFLLFSDQSMLTYSVKTKKSYRNFVEYTLKENTTLDDFPPYSTNDVKWLIEIGLCYIDDKGYVKCNDLCLIIKQLYENEVITYVALKNTSKVDVLIDKGLCKIGDDKLFSIPEYEYFSFLLNKECFNNGPDIRNKYSHGSFIASEKEHMNNYYILLRIMILTVLKTDYEFILYNNLNK